MELLFRGDAETGLSSLEDVLARYPLESIGLLDRPYLDLASFYAYAGRSERAKEMVEQYQQMIPPELKRRPGQQNSYHHALGDIAMAEGRFSDAVAEYYLADESTGCAICELPQLGRAYDEGGEADSAIAIYERYLATPWPNREFPDALTLHWMYERLAALYESQRETEKAVYTTAASWTSGRRPTRSSSHGSRRRVAPSRPFHPTAEAQGTRCTITRASRRCS